MKQKELTKTIMIWNFKNPLDFMVYKKNNSVL